jgi:capsular exopolysaccharide synthesis family protein
MMNEAFRVLRTNVDLLLGRKQGPKVIMATSFNPSAGKTFNVMNLAASMAIKGARSLLVDLDLRKASLSKSLDLNHSGVAAYLNGKIDNFEKYIDPIAENFYILPVGTLPPNPSELLISDRFAEMLEKMKEQFDYIFLDCPPIDIVADSNIVTSHVDLTIMVLRANLIRKDVLPILEGLYRSNKFNHMALILNGVELSYKKYGYGSSGYGYGYGYSSVDE